MTFSFAHLADYFTAVALLDAENDPRKQHAIAKLLGLTSDTTPEAEAPEPHPEPEVPLPQKEQTPRADITSGGGAATQHAPRPRSQQSRRLRFIVTARPPERRSRPDWLEHIRPLPPPRPVIATPPEPPPLLARRWSRAILSTAISRQTVTNSVDLDAIIRATARGLPLRAVPRRIIQSLSGGVQVLVDRGPGNAPFAADQELLVRQIRAVAGHERVQVLRLDPARGFVAGTGPRHRWIDYFALPRPAAGTTVVLLSDLGIATVPLETNADPEAWQTFIVKLRARDHRVVAFVPYARWRWPALLRKHVGIIPWDRRTSVQAVRRFLGRGARRSGR